MPSLYTITEKDPKLSILFSNVIMLSGIIVPEKFPLTAYIFFHLLFKSPIFCQLSILGITFALLKVTSTFPMPSGISRRGSTTPCDVGVLISILPVLPGDNSIMGVLLLSSAFRLRPSLELPITLPSTLKSSLHSTIFPE